MLDGPHVPELPVDAPRGVAVRARALEADGRRRREGRLDRIVGARAEHDLRPSDRGSVGLHAPDSPSKEYASHSWMTALSALASTARGSRNVRSNLIGLTGSRASCFT